MPVVVKMSALPIDKSAVIKAAKALVWEGLRLALLMFLSLVIAQLLDQLLLHLERSFDPISWQEQIMQRIDAENGAFVIPGTWADFYDLGQAFIGVPALMVLIFYRKRVNFFIGFILFCVFVVGNFLGGDPVYFVVTHLTKLFGISAPEFLP